MRAGIVDVSVGMERLAGAPRWSLIAGIASPVLYFAAQVAAAPFHPGYDVMRQPASDLGSTASTQPWIFNSLIMLSGLAACAAVPAFVRGVSALDDRRWLVWLIALALLSSGAASMWAGWFPLPDPRHSPGVWGIGTVFVPLLLCGALWPVEDADAVALRRYLLLNLLIGFVFTPLTRDAAVWQEHAGVVQRINALIVYAPTGVVAWWMLSHTRRRRSSPANHA